MTDAEIVARVITIWHATDHDFGLCLLSALMSGSYPGQSLLN